MLLIKILNSLWSIIIIRIHAIFIRDGINQYIDGIKKINKIVLIQFIDKYENVVGSKEEKRFIIIFN